MRERVLETDRLVLRQITLEDAPFILELLTGRAFLENIGDRGVREIESARDYIRTGPMASYETHGFGLLLVERRDDGESLGICGLLKRETLDDVDLGFAVLPEHWGQGYASEAAAAVMTWGRHELGLERIVAVVSPHNATSIRVLEKLGMHREGTVRLQKKGSELLLFA